MISTKKKCTQLISIHMSNRTQVYMDVRCMVMEQRAMIQIFMVFPAASTLLRPTLGKHAAVALVQHTVAIITKLGD